MVRDMIKDIGVTRYTDPDLLINPDFARQKSWSVVAISDRPIVTELEELLENSESSVVFVKPLVFCYMQGDSVHSFDIDRNPKNLARLLLEYSGGNVIVYDKADTFILSVVMGDLTLIACSRAIISKIFGISSISQESIREVIEGIMPDIKKRLRQLYEWP